MRHVWYYITILYVMYMVIILKDIMVIMVIILLYYIIYYYIRYICHVSPTLLLYYYITIFIAIYYYYCIILLYYIILYYIILYYIILYYIILYYYYIITILLLYYVLYWSFFEAPFHLSIPSDWRGRTLLLCSAHHDGRRFLWSAATTQFHWWYICIYIYIPFHIWDVIFPIDELIFFKMVKTTNHIYIYLHQAHWSIYTYIHIISPNIDWF